MALTDRACFGCGMAAGTVVGAPVPFRAAVDAGWMESVGLELELDGFGGVVADWVAPIVVPCCDEELLEPEELCTAATILNSHPHNAGLVLVVGLAVPVYASAS